MQPLGDAQPSGLLGDPPGRIAQAFGYAFVVLLVSACVEAGHGTKLRRARSQQALSRHALMYRTSSCTTSSQSSRRPTCRTCHPAARPPQHAARPPHLSRRQPLPVLTVSAPLDCLGNCGGIPIVATLAVACLPSPLCVGRPVTSAPAVRVEGQRFNPI